MFVERPVRVTVPEDARPGLTVAEIALPVSLKATWGVVLTVTTLDDVNRATPVPAFRLRTVPGETKSAVSPEAVEPLASPCWTAFPPGGDRARHSQIPCAGQRCDGRGSRVPPELTIAGVLNAVPHGR